jgi:hypothetical protein
MAAAQTSTIKDSKDCNTRRNKNSKPITTPKIQYLNFPANNIIPKVKTKAVLRKNPSKYSGWATPYNDPPSFLPIINS